MTEISLVLPLSIPPAELAPDLIRALQAPALASLLSRSASRRRVPIDLELRALPHETWLARALGLERNGLPAFATAVMRAYGLEPGDGTWFLVHPSHIEIARSHLLLHDQRSLMLGDAEARALFDSARPYFDEVGKPLLYGDAHNWFMRADDWRDLATASPDAAVGLNMTDFLPVGEGAVGYRRLQNEVQMLWFSHPVNATREQRGLAAINGFWPWAAAAGQPKLPTLVTSGAPAWLARLGTERSVEALVQEGKDATLACCELVAPALAGEWGMWLAQMQELEQAVFQPLLAALTSGRVRQVRLVTSHRTEQIETTTTRMSQRYFWKRPTLDALMP